MTLQEKKDEMNRLMNELNEFIDKTLKEGKPLRALIVASQAIMTMEQLRILASKPVEK